jgi:hypothetical protein
MDYLLVAIALAAVAQMAYRLFLNGTSQSLQRKPERPERVALHPASVDGWKEKHKRPQFLSP